MNSTKTFFDVHITENFPIFTMIHATNISVEQHVYFRDYPKKTCVAVI